MFTISRLFAFLMQARGWAVHRAAHSVVLSFHVDLDERGTPCAFHTFNDHVLFTFRPQWFFLCLNPFAYELAWVSPAVDEHHVSARSHTLLDVLNIVVDVLIYDGRHFFQHFKCILRYIYNTPWLFVKPICR
jgi:hypothetical protein